MLVDDHAENDEENLDGAEQMRDEEPNDDVTQMSVSVAEMSIDGNGKKLLNNF